MSRFSTAMFLAVMGLLTVEVRAQNPGDVGSPECREVQLQAQAAVLAGAPYRIKGGAVRTASRVVEPYVRSGFITAECSSCIMNQFGRGIPIKDQKCCGPCCGDAVCQPGEDACNCHDDCVSTCGDGCCFIGNAHNGNATIEDSCNCPGDCGSSCGDTCCNGSETTCTCPGDCGSSCGDTCCNGSETPCSCPSDCGQHCGNTICDYCETPCSCPQDCNPTVAGIVTCCGPSVASGGCCGDRFCDSGLGENEFNCPEDCD